MLCGAQTGCGAVLLQLLAVGLSNGAAIALSALGVTLVYSVVRTVNFAHGDLFALSSVVVTSVVNGLALRRDSPPLLLAGGLALGLAAAMAFGALTNVLVERLAFRPFRGRSRLAPLVAGIGLSFILFQAALFWRTVQEVGLGNPEHHSDIDNLAGVSHTSIPDLLPNLNLVQAAGLSLPVIYRLKDLLVLLVTLGLALLVAWFLRSTRAGRMLRACAQDPEQALLCGVDRDGAVRLVFALGGALAGAGAFVFALYYGRPFGQSGAQSGLLAFTAAVVGGVGNPFGALLCGLLLGVLSAFSDYFLPAQWTPVLVLATLVGLLALRPTGLAGEGPAGDSTEQRGAEALAERRADPRRDRRALALLGALALAYPLLDQALGLQRQAVVNGLLIFALLALGLNLVLGFAGLLDLGYAACFGVGGYAAALLLTAGGRPQPVQFGLVLLASLAAAGLFGLFSATLTLRLRGDYLAIVALALGQMLPRVVVNLSQWTGGNTGMTALPPPLLLSVSLGSMVQRYYLTLLLLALVALGCLRLAGSRLGRAWAALREDEQAAQSCGVSLRRTRPLVFVLAAAVGGVAAALFATTFGYVDPDQADFQVSALVLAMVVVGGAGSVPGAILGALLIGAYNQILLPQLAGWWGALAQASGAPWMRIVDLGALSYLSFGLALYLTVLLRARVARGERRADPARPGRRLDAAET